MAVRVDGLGVEVTREASTEVLYGKRLRTLRKRATCDIGYPARLWDTIDCFALAHLEFARATIRQYSAALAWAIEAAAESGELDEPQAVACRERLQQRPVSRPSSAAPRTSAKKRKTMQKNELHLVCQALRKRAHVEDNLLTSLLVNNIAFGLRPCEYSGADLGEVWLVVRSAKATNGRALSETRELELEGLRDGQIDSLRKLIANVDVAANGNVPALIDRLGARLRRVCRRLKIEPFALYTTRHQAIANAKANGTAEEVAAFAGHASVHTARKSYAPRSSAWSIKKTVRASPKMLQLLQARRAPTMRL